MATTHTLGCVSTESKAQGIGATLGNPCWEVGLLQDAEQTGWSALPTCCSSTPGVWPPYLSFFGFLHLSGIQVAVQ